jgi:FkbM family methyltransferase
MSEKLNSMPSDMIKNFTRIIRFCINKFILTFLTVLLLPSLLPQPISFFTIKFYKNLDYTKNRIKMRIESIDQLHRSNSCKKEPETVKWIEEFIKPGDVFYDIGANVGAYSLVCYAHTKGQSQIYSFEPSVTTFSGLIQNIMINGYSDKIVALPFILSDGTMIKKFYYSSFSPGAASHAIDVKNAQSDEMKSLSSGKNSRKLYNYLVSYRLDDLLSGFNLPLPNHMKIDVDGHELEVLKGCENLLGSELLKTILIEIDKNCASSPEIIALLEEKKFKIKNIYPHGDGTLSNYIFIRSQ